MPDVRFFTLSRESLEWRFTLRYFDEDWHELDELRYEGADDQGIMVAIHQWLMIKAVSDQPLGVPIPLRKATSLNLEVDYE